MMVRSLSHSLAVSTWSLHRRLERPDVSLLQIPAEVAAHGLSALEICHFHFPSVDDGYLSELRGAFDKADVQFLSLLVDAGDPTHPDPAERARQLDMMAGWVDVAAKMGARRARVIAGDAAPSPKTLEQSAAALTWLADRAEAGGVRLEVDFGNWPDDRKHHDLPLIAHLAETTHAKAHFPQAGEMDTDDFGRCLSICRAAGYAGPHSLIFDGPGDEWRSIDTIRDFVLAR